MAVQPQTPFKEYTANGTTTVFPLDFDCENKDHLIVMLDDAETDNSTWSLNNKQVTFNAAPSAGKKITLQRNTPYRRDRNYQAYDNSFRPDPVNKDFDWIWWKLQELGVADWLLKTYVDRLHQQQENKINDLKTYVDDRDDELRAYLMEEIRKQGVALDQLDEYYNYLMERLAQIAVDKGWDASFVVDASGKTQQELNDQWVDVSLLMQDGSISATENTLRLLAAISSAVTLKKGIRCARRDTVYLNQDISFVGVYYADFQANIIMLDNKQVYVGDNAPASAYHNFKFQNITNGLNTTTTEPPIRPIFKICGLMQSDVEIGQCNYVQLYADAANVQTRSTAYNNIYLTGQTTKFEVTDSGVGGSWVTENKIYGGRILKIHQKGIGFKHNKNEFFSPCIENASPSDNKVELIFDNVSNSHIFNCRLESVVNAGAIQFKNGARSNYVFKNYGHSGNSRENFTDLSYIVDDQSGENNLATTEDALFFRKSVLATFDAKSDTILATSTSSTCDNSSVCPPRDGYSALIVPNFSDVVVANASGKEFITTDLIAVNKFDAFNIFADYDGAVGIIRFYLYDVNLNPILTDTTDKLMLSPIFGSFNTSDGFYYNGSARNMSELNQYPFLVNDDLVKYVRVCFRVSAALTKVRSVNITKFHKRNSGQNENYARSPQKHSMSLNGMITRGFARFGQSYFDNLSKIQNTCIMSLETSSAAAVSSGSTVINLKHIVAATFSETTRSTVKAGDFIGVLMSNGSVHWSRVSSISGNDVTLTNELTADVTIGAMIRVNRWNYHTIAPSFAEITVAANSASTRNITVQYATVGANVKVELATPYADIILTATVISATSVQVTVRNLSSVSVTIAATNIRVIVENT